MYGDDMEMVIWNAILSGLVALLGFVAKSKFDELDRIAMLLNRTREEIAREHVTRAEMDTIVNRLAEHMDASIKRLEDKIDRLFMRRSDGA